MKNFYFVFLILTGFVFHLGASAQSTTNYTFSTATDASLTDMSSGTMQLVAPNTDGLGTGIFSTINDIGFTFYFMSSAYTNFVVTEDGVIRLGNSLAGINRIPELNINEPRIVAFACDMYTGTNGKVHYKVTGTSPNRVLVVEWLNLYIAYPSPAPQTGNSTFQIRLYETTGKIEFVYGYMYASVHRGGQEDYGAIGITSGNSNNNLMYKTGNFTNANTGTTLAPATILTTLITGTGEITGLSSSTDGARRIYTFTPRIAPAAPSNLTFSGISQTSITLNWTDNSNNETHFHIYRSEDGGTTYELVKSVAADAVTSGPITGLPSKNYLWRVYAVNEGACSDALEGSCSTLAAGDIHSTATGGNWSNPATWVGNILPVSTDNVTIVDGATVIINNNTPVCNNVTVGEGTSGILRFIGAASNATLTCDGDVIVASNGLFDITTGATGGTRKLIIGNRSLANANMTVDGTFDMNCTGANSYADVEFRGTADGIVSGTGATCDFYSITLNKGTSIDGIVDFQRVFTISSPSAGNATRLNMTNGTFKMSAPCTIEPYYGTLTIVPATARIWLNNNNAVLRCVGAGTATGPGDVTINGYLEISAGTFAYGTGNNNMSVSATGTVELDGVNGNIIMYGRATFANLAHLNIFNGNFYMDPQAGANLATGPVFSMGTTTYVNFTGGTLTFIDPPAINTTDFSIPSNGEQNKILHGCTIRFGNGASSSNGNATSGGFVLSIPTLYGLQMGNIIVDNPAGTNRVSKFAFASGTYIDFNNITVNAGTLNQNVTIEVRGNIVNNGTLDYTTATTMRLTGTALQTYSGTGTQAATNNLTLDMRNSSGFTLNVPYQVYGLTMTTGNINTTVANSLTIVGSTAGVVTLGSVTSFVNGPLRRTLGTTSGNFAFPVGKSTYTPFELRSARANAGTVVVTAEVFDADCGGTFSAAGYDRSTSRYWQASTTGALQTASNPVVRVYESTPTTGMHIGQSATLAGLYTDVFNAAASNYVETVTQPALNLALNFFCLAAPGYFKDTVYVGAGQTYLSYTRTGGLFEAINARGLKGNLVAMTTSDIMNEDGTNALNAWAELNGSGYTFKIQSSAAALRIVSGTGAGGVFRFNNADRVNVDGRYNGSGSFLTFRCTNLNPAFTFLNDASVDTLQYLTIESGNTGASSGTILFSTSTAGAVGNIQNIVSNCIIRDRSDIAGVPANAVASVGTLAKTNSNISITNCRIFNFTTAGIYLGADAGSNWTISNNSLYQPTTRSTAQCGIDVQSGNGHTIENNYIGGSDVSCGSGAWTNSGNVAVRGIRINTTTGTATSVQKNTIQNFSLSGNNTGTYFYGIDVLTTNTGPVNIGNVTGNTIGHASTANSISVAAQTNVIGIYSTSAASVSIWNNTIANITNSSNNNAAGIRGLVHTGAGSANVAYNNIHDISTASAKVAAAPDFAAMGIYYGGTSSGFITENTIYNIICTNNASLANQVTGITLTGTANPTINRNKIWAVTNASVPAAGINPVISGINIISPAAGSVAEVRLNFISLGSGLNNDLQISGIWLSSNATAYTAKVNYNSVCISGTPAGTRNSYAFIRGSAVTNATVSMRNNIFANGRTGGTGKHYAIANTGAAPATGWSATASNYNLLVSSNAAFLGIWNNLDQTIANWKMNTLGDNQSLSAETTTGASTALLVNLSNLFTDVANGDLHINTGNAEAWYCNGKGIQTTIANDIDNNVRSTAVLSGGVDIGADEFNTSVDPIPALSSGTISNGSTTTYSFGNRTQASIIWHGANFPTAITLKYWSQKDPALTDGMGVPYPAITGAKYSNAYWSIDATGGTIADFTYDLSLNYDDPLLFTLDDPASMNMGKIPYIYPTPATPPASDDWGVYVSTNNTANKTAAVAGIIGFSDFTLLKGSTIPLPIELVSFTAECEDEIVVLTWVTASETNNDYFTLEKSYNGINFEPLTRVAGAGNSNEMISYSVMDDNIDSPLPANIYYYRLKQTDFNGKYSYSEVVAAGCKSEMLSDVFISTTPENIIVSISGNPGDNYAVEIFDMVGRYIFRKGIVLNENTEIVSIPLNELSAGSYNLAVRSSGGVKSKQLVITR